MDVFTPYLSKCTASNVKDLLVFLSVPEPESISFPSSQGELHQIVLLTWPEKVVREILAKQNLNLTSDESTTSLILRIAAGNMPRIKSENEVATMKWLASETSIPVAQIVLHDNTTANPLGYEYMFMTYINGVEGAKIYYSLTDQQMIYILDQLADQAMQLFTKPFDHIGGLKISPEDGRFVPGPVVDATQWTVPEIEKYWPKTVTFNDLNPTSEKGYSSFTDFLTAYMKCYLWAIPKHPALQSLPYLSHTNVNLLKSFIETINQPEVAAEINDLRYVLAHRDLHFGQLLLDPETARITAVLDWEFAAVTVFPLWETCFLWNADNTIPWDENVRAHRAPLRQKWKSRVQLLERGQEMLDQTVWKTDKQEAAWDVVNYLRCIVEVIPRSRQLDDAKNWWREIVKALKVLEVGGGSASASEGPRLYQQQQNGSDSRPRSPVERPDAYTMADAKKKINGNPTREEGVNEVMHRWLISESTEQHEDPNDGREISAESGITT